ncbi:MAG TPA: hypothetical protein VHE37_01850, partial [Nevskiaceae bacterium]|nr:hypothetical protein [Nevskiaceae bacterium]
MAWLNAGSINAQNVDTHNLGGLFFTNDPSVIGSGGSPINATPGAGMYIAASGRTRASTMRIYAHDDAGGDIGFGVVADASSGVEAETDGAIVDVIPGFLTQFNHPLSGEGGGSGGNGIPADLALPANDITAQQFSIRFGKASTLADSILTATGSPANDSGFIDINNDSSLQGQRIALDVGGSSTWTGNQVTVAHSKISGGSLTINANGVMDNGTDYPGGAQIEDATLNLDTLLVQANDAGILIEGDTSTPSGNASLVHAHMLTLDATDKVDLANARLAYTNGTITGDKVTVDNSLLTGLHDPETDAEDQLTLTGHGLNHGIAVQFQNGGAINASNATLVADHGLISLDNASVTVHADVSISANDGNIELLDNSVMNYNTAELTAMGHAGLDQNDNPITVGGTITIGSSTASSSRTDAVFNSGGKTTLTAYGISLDHSTIAGGNLTATADKFVDARHSVFSGTGTDLTAHGARNGAGINLVADDFEYDNHVGLHADQAIAVADESGATGGTSSISAPLVLLESGAAVGLTNTGASGDRFVVRGVNGNAQAGSFSASNSNLSFGSSITIDALGLAEIDGGQLNSIAGYGGGPADGTVTLRAGSVQINGATIDGSHATRITAGLSAPGGARAATTASGDLDLSGTIGDSGSYVLLAAAGNVAQNGTLTINANALDVASHNGFIDLGTSVINVGGGTAVGGHDHALQQNLDSDGLFPASPGPNAAFQAAQDIALGTLNFTTAGHYLYVSAGSAPPVGS